jgi:hypothetical protein
VAVAGVHSEKKFPFLSFDCDWGQLSARSDLPAHFSLPAASSLLLVSQTYTQSDIQQMAGSLLIFHEKNCNITAAHSLLILILLPLTHTVRKELAAPIARSFIDA